MVKPKTLFIGLLAVAVLIWAVILDPFDSTVTLKPGAVVRGLPTQTPLPIPGASFRHKGFTIVPMAAFHVKAKVLSRKNYYLDSAAAISPLDLALGWGPMSDQYIVDQFSISQRRRGTYLRVDPFPLSSRRELTISYTNMHTIPASDYIRHKMDKVRKGEIVVMTGMLVNVFRRGFEWTTSLSREDSGQAGCEIMWVSDFEILPIPEHMRS